MNDDVLERATRALREEGSPSQRELAEARARLVTSSHISSARKANALRWVLPLAAAFLAGTAFAATNGPLELAVRTVRTWLAESADSEERASKTNTSALEAVSPRPAEAAAPTASVTPEAEPATAPATAEEPERMENAAVHPPAEPQLQSTLSRRPRAQPRSAESVTPHATLAVSETLREAEPATEPQPNPDLALYRSAHRTHFAGVDAEAALGHWNAYLRRFPNGMFALEARYNRALCLVRLGRRDEAARALSPFAEGAVSGAYRREEARALLKALSPPSSKK